MNTDNKSYASICLYGTNLDPEYISKLVGVSASYACREGDVFESSSGNRREAQTGRLDAQQ